MSDLEAVYSPGRRRKKKAIAIMSLIAMTNGSEEAWAMKEIERMTRRGTGLTLFGGGSCFFQADIMREMRKSIFPKMFKRGSGDPTLWNVCPMNRK